MTTQYGSFDGLDNRREVMNLLKRLGAGLPEEQQAIRRSRFLRGLLKHSTNGLAAKQMDFPPCSVIEAYFGFLAITGTLGVPIEKAARLLEREVSRS